MAFFAVRPFHFSDDDSVTDYMGTHNVNFTLLVVFAACMHTWSFGYPPVPPDGIHGVTLEA